MSEIEIIDNIFRGKYKKILKEISKEDFLSFVINSNNAQIIYKVAYDFQGIDKEVFSRAIVNTGNIYNIIRFAMNISGANLNALAEGIYLKQKPYEKIFLSKDYEENPIAFLERRIIEEVSEREILHSLFNIKKSNKPLLINIIIRMRNVRMVINTLICAKNLSKWQRTKLLEIVYSCGEMQSFFEKLIETNNYKRFFLYIDEATIFLKFSELAILFSQININNLTDEYKIKYIECIYKYKLSKYINISLIRGELATGKGIKRERKKGAVTDEKEL